MATEADMIVRTVLSVLHSDSQQNADIGWVGGWVGGGHG